MSLRNEDRELQIELARLQMKHQTILSTFFGLLAVEFSLLGIVYGFHHTTSNVQLKPLFLLVMLVSIPIIFFTISHFSKILKELEEQTGSLRMKYVW